MAKKILTNILGFAAGIVAFRLVQMAETGFYSFSLWLLGLVEVALGWFFSGFSFRPGAYHGTTAVLVGVVSVLAGWAVCWFISAPTKRGRIPALMVLGPAMAFVMAINLEVMLTYNGPLPVWLQAGITFLGAAGAVLAGIFGKNPSPLYRKRR